MGRPDASVLHVDTERGWRGGQQQAVYLYQYMLEQGTRTDFVCRRGSRLERYMADRGHPHIALPLSGEADIVSARAIARHARDHSFNVLYLHSAHALSIGLMARLQNGTIRTIAVRRVDFPIRKNPLSLLKYTTRRLDRVVAISENIRRVMVSDGVPAEKIEVIRSGVDIHRFDDDVALSRDAAGVPEDSIIVGTVAGMVDHKDYPTLLRAAAKVTAANNRVTFVAAGSGPERERILRLSDELGLRERFVFLGERGDIGAVLKMLDIFVLASKLEGLGTSVLDAMSVRLPVVGTLAGGIPEMVSDGENGLLVPPESHESLAEGILALVGDAKLRERLGRGALDRVRDFDHRTMGERSLELCRSLV